MLFQWSSLNFTWQTPEAYAQWWQAQGTRRHSLCPAIPHTPPSSRLRQRDARRRQGQLTRRCVRQHAPLEAARPRHRLRHPKRLPLYVPASRSILPALSVRHTHCTPDLNGSYLANPVVPVSPLFDPFPSWAANTEGDPNALQSVLGFEIDPEDRIWILDQVRMVRGYPVRGISSLFRCHFCPLLNHRSQGQGLQR